MDTFDYYSSLIETTFGKVPSSGETIGTAIGRWEIMNEKVIDGFYSGYFTGLAGISFGIFVFKDGVISGIDAGEGIYDGEYEASPDGEHVTGTVSFEVPVGMQTITGAAASDEPLKLQIPFKLPLKIDPEEVHRIETPAGPINAKFKKLRDI